MTSRVSQFAVPAGVILIIVLMVIPIPTFLLDILIVMNIALALLIVLVSMYVKHALEFSVFPSLLLLATLFRLALNISATRLVLLDGDAGAVIGAFGHFVVGGSLIVGLVVFMILIVIQFVVITKGAERVAEVGARFTLDAMPGKQMAIDADLNAGLIDEVEAKRRRAEVTAEADFYGAMDGASKFVKGDAIAAVIITLINLIGGFTVGMLQRGMSPGEAINVYSLLTVGDGLVSQVPALLLSVATGLTVTRSSATEDMGTQVATQFSRNKRALQIGGGAVVALAMLPGLPVIPFLLVGGGVLLMAQRVPKPGEEPAQLPEGAAAADAPAPDSPETLLAEMRVDPLELALAPDLVDLVDAAGGDLLDRVRALRRKIALELGVVLPPVRTRDDLALDPSTYVIRISGSDVASGFAPPGTVLAIGEGLEQLPGKVGTEPVFGLAGKWIPAELRHQAELTGATVVDRASVVVTHLAEVTRTHASRLLGREDVRALTDVVRRTHPIVVEELTPGLLSLGEIQRVLHRLLDEGVAIRDLVRIFESLSMAAKGGTELDRLVEAARLSLGPAIAARYAVDGALSVITLDPRIEQSLLESLRLTDAGAQLAIDPELAEILLGDLTRLTTAVEDRGSVAVLACAPQLRAAVYRLVHVAVPRLAVLSYSELAGGTHRIDTVGVVNSGYTIAA
ncbi:flagellar biosynthesis protein FlhA [Actinophytocola xanthii]|uniref:EscV/YscV/HrcV family type III secretion system export apparatus protein n=1 Tax=Actinophytocola xanthii TaxID=1912961 RepID=A0A1Q8BXT2_9PSEU|nr:flagellar biosynthesis protein FlhA [Actinophytocola xanthii]OLF06913.1 EscV/YscV/HrcV family type III secretion system export apparatus protein [Actinophytocola xanthii]